MNNLKEIEQIKQKNEQNNRLLLHHAESFLMIWASGLSTTKDTKPQESCKEARKPCVVFIFHLRVPVWEGSTTGQAAIKTMWVQKFFFSFVCQFNFLWSYSLPFLTPEKLKNRKELEEHCRPVKENQGCH